MWFIRCHVVRLAARSGYLYIALSDLLLSPSILKSEFQSLGSPLCMLKGADIIQNVKYTIFGAHTHITICWVSYPSCGWVLQGGYSSTAPQIVLGSRVLQSLYFAVKRRSSFQNVV